MMAQARRWCEPHGAQNAHACVSEPSCLTLMCPRSNGCHLLVVKAAYHNMCRGACGKL